MYHKSTFVVGHSLLIQKIVSLVPLVPEVFLTYTGLIVLSIVILMMAQEKTTLFSFFWKDNRKSICKASILFVYHSKLLDFFCLTLFSNIIFPYKVSHVKSNIYIFERNYFYYTIFLELNLFSMNIFTI